MSEIEKTIVRNWGLGRRDMRLDAVVMLAVQIALAEVGLALFGLAGWL